jgi:amino acid transporter
MSYITGWVWLHFVSHNTGLANFHSLALRVGLGMCLYSSTPFMPISVLIYLQLSGIAGVCFFTAGLIEALIILHNPTYVPQPYHSTLLIMAVAAFSLIFNTFLAKKLPLVEGILLLVHVCGFFAILVPLWALAPRANASDVFTTFYNGGDWNSLGTSTLVGLLAAVISLTGSDSAAHMCMSFLLQ